MCFTDPGGTKSKTKTKQHASAPSRPGYAWDPVVGYYVPPVDKDRKGWKRGFSQRNARSWGVYIGNRQA